MAPQYRIGDVTITPVDELRQASPAAAIYPDLHPEQLAWLLRSHGDWLIGPYLDAEGNRQSAIRTYVVRDAGRTILVDTCIGNHKHRAGTGFDRWHLLDTPFLARLAAVGVDPEEVDLVVCTHLHIDHIGWNTRWDGKAWVPTFPNARYLWVDEEWHHWRQQAIDTRDSLLVDDSMQPCVDAGLVDLVPIDFAVSDVISLEDTRGHTPAHACVRVEDRSGATPGAVLSGDLMHSPLQMALPDLLVTYDSDPLQGRIARREFLERYADTGVLVLGAHFGGDGGGFVQRDGDAYRFLRVDAASS